MSREPTPSSPAAGTGLERWLIALGALAAWSIVPPCLGPVLGLDLDGHVRPQPADEAT